MLTHAARKIYNTNSAKVIGLFFSQKMQRHLPFESTLERDWLLWLEFDKTVKTIVSQSRTFKTSQSQYVSAYTPDFEVQIAGKSHPIFYEVKPHSVATSKKFSLRFAACKLLLLQHSCELRCVTEKEIRREPQLTNLKRLSAYARGPVLNDASKLSLQTMLATQPQRIDVVIKALDLQLAEIYHAIFIGDLITDLSIPISRHSEITLAEMNDVS